MTLLAAREQARSAARGTSDRKLDELVAQIDDALSKGVTATEAGKLSRRVTEAIERGRVESAWARGYQALVAARLAARDVAAGSEPDIRAAFDRLDAAFVTVPTKAPVASAPTRKYSLEPCTGEMSPLARVVCSDEDVRLAPSEGPEMKRTRFTEEQIIAILKEQEAGVPVADLCRKHGVSNASIYKGQVWRHGCQRGPATEGS